MASESITNIKETQGGYPIKDLRWLPVDSIFVGLVKDPVFGKPTLRDGYVAAQWNKSGKPIKANKGRAEMILKFDYEKENTL